MTQWRIVWRRYRCRVCHKWTTQCFREPVGGPPNAARAAETCGDDCRQELRRRRGRAATAKKNEEKVKTIAQLRMKRAITSADVQWSTPEKAATLVNLVLAGEIMYVRIK